MSLADTLFGVPSNCAAIDVLLFELPARAYHGLLLPLLGFIFLPLTTLAYAWMMNTGQVIAGLNLVILVIAIVIDLGGIGGGEYHRRTR